ncbi:MAG TPA: hypothetical protein VN800_06020 [Candidatus Acidoferrales bacterium]|nr:hypothetical protein [Candidatus Acidoferrales bacterium]
MTNQQGGPYEVRPNTLRDQRAPNTFRNQVVAGADGGRQQLNSGGGNMGPLRRIPRPQVSIWVYVVAAVLAVVLVLVLLSAVQ